ncbi:MAG: PIG-L deacetylase family protein [Candidatus Helarchaeota archaeon]
MKNEKISQEHIAVFAAHPDDEGSVWGTLQKYYEFGSKISLIWMTCGDKFIASVKKYVNYLPLLIKSFYSKKIQEKLSIRISEIRKKEAIMVANLINATPYFLEFKDTEIPSFKDKIALKKIVGLIRKIKPTIILTHWNNELHKDHKNTSNLITKSYFLSDNPNIITDHAPYKPRILAFWDERGKNFKPNFFLNVSDQISYIKKWGKYYNSQSFRIVGRFVKFRYSINAKKTPYSYAEAYYIYNKKSGKSFGQFFPK